jgi:hypothetical protein
MSKEELHEFAESTTPAEINVPKTWAGLAVWALGKWGIGVVFLALLVPVYQDLKISNSRFYEIIRQNAEISTQNVRVMEALATKIEASNTAIQRLNDAIIRLENTALK